MKRITSIVLGAAMALLSYSALAQPCNCDFTTNLVANGDFSAGNTGFTSSLPFNMTCFSQSYGVGAEARDKCNNSQWANDLWDHTVGNPTGSYMIVDGWNNTNANAIWTTTSTVNVVAGLQYTFSFWQVRGISSALSTQTLEMRVGGATIATVNTAGAPQLGWTEYCATWTATTTGPVSVSIWQTGPFGGNQDYGIDDVYFGPCQTACVVNAGFNTQASPDGCTIDFTSNVTTNGVTTVIGYEWTFGDGFSSTDANPNHTYTAPGVYQVCLTVYAVNQDGECCQVTVCREIQVECQPEPCFAEITDILPSSPVCPQGPCEVLLQAVIPAFSGSIVGYYWNFGDGTTGTSTGSSILHNFPGNGVYNVCVTVILKSGPDECCAFTFCREIEIFCPPRQAKAANNAPEVIEGSFSDETIHTNDALGLFPNPGMEQLNMVLNVDEASNANVSIRNIEGKEVLNQRFLLGGGNMKSLDVTQLPAGVYIIQVQTENKQYTQNWIKR